MTDVVIVHTDDTGRYIGPYGHGIETPALTALAEEGVRFRNACCAGPTCSPSRGAVMTGMSPHANGLIGLAHRGFEMDDYGRHLAGYLSERGYESVLAGQQHEVDADDRHEAARTALGYDRTLRGDPEEVEIPFDSGSTRRDLANTALAADYIREADDPFFLSVGLYNTHQPMPLEQDIVDPGAVQPPAPLPDVPPVREEMAGYHLLARYVDRCMGQVTEALRDAGRLEDALVVFTTDHGIPFPRMKCNLFEGGIGVSLLARFPESAGVDPHTEDALVSNTDLFPTVCETLGVDVPEWVEGDSLVGLARGETGRVHDAVFSEVTYHAAYEPKRCVRTDRYKYIRRYGDYDGYVLPNTDAGPSKSFLMEAGFFDGAPPAEALYDLYHDPNEANNLADDPDYADVLADLSGRLTDWMERTGDPLLDGPVPKPEGALANPQDCEQPNSEVYEEPDIR